MNFPSIATLFLFCFISFYYSENESHQYTELLRERWSSKKRKASQDSHPLLPTVPSLQQKSLGKVLHPVFHSRVMPFQLSVPSPHSPELSVIRVTNEPVTIQLGLPRQYQFRSVLRHNDRAPVTFKGVSLWPISYLRTLPRTYGLPTAMGNSQSVRRSHE